MDIRTVQTPQNSNKFNCGVFVFIPCIHKKVIRLITFQSDIRGYTEVSWCPWLKHVIMGVHSEGLHFWDISRHTTAPLYCFHLWGISSAKFNNHSRVNDFKTAKITIDFYFFSDCYNVYHNWRALYLSPHWIWRC